MRSGAVGINLTQANRVFLMEPAMNPALEAQAIGRVYRLGQTKSVQIIKLCMKNSFESRLIKVLRRKFGTISKPSTLNSAEEEKKTDDRGSETNKKVVGGSDSPAIATLGHMTKDKAELMTEEFDALFGLTEPEDLPEIKVKEKEEEENDSTPSSPSSARSFDSESYNSLAPSPDQAHQRGPLFWRSPSEDEDEDGCEIS
jgi:superfamily II DNA or RNA helicase